MEYAEIKKMHAFENFYWWHVGRRNILERLLKKTLNSKGPVLEMGCGSGGNLSMLRTFGQVTGLDPSKEALAFCRLAGFLDVQEGYAEHTGLPSESFQTLVMLDVLEHIEDDAQALRECFRVIKPGGFAFFTVPAFSFLWSEHDEALHHKRRYRLAEVRQKIESAGFHTVKISYLIMFPFPLVVVYRALHKTFKQDKNKKTSYVVLPNWLNKIFIKIIEAEGFLLQYINLPFGTSIVCIVKKPLDDNSSISPRESV